MDDIPCQAYGLYSGEGELVRNRTPCEVLPRNWRLEAKADRERVRQVRGELVSGGIMAATSRDGLSEVRK